VNSSNDHVFRTHGDDPAVKQLISICGQPFMAVVKLERTEVLFVASEDVTDLNAEVGDALLADYFSSFVPHAMALRYAAGNECWRPSKGHAAIVIDDPLLRQKYGFLDFDSLLRLADIHKFHAAIAFIPHNFRRSSSRITRMFLENAARLSICFHGCDHTEAEFASTDLALLTTLLWIAENRMSSFHQLTGLTCDPVMVFPQGNFSKQAMMVLKSHNFYGAVNTVPYPMEEPVRLTVGELAQPAVIRYGGFPLFLRKPVRKIQNHEIAFNLFFGRPVLVVEHHEIFQHTDSLVEIATRINSVAPEICWSNLATVVSHSILTRYDPEGMQHVRAYSNTVVVSNDSWSPRAYLIEWDNSSGNNLIDYVLADGMPRSDFEFDDARIQFSVEIPPNSSRRFSLIHRGVHGAVRNLSPRRKAEAFLRRRLSEVRDNYLSKNEHLLRVSEKLKQFFLQ